LSHSLPAVFERGTLVRVYQNVLPRHRTEIIFLCFSFVKLIRVVLCVCIQLEHNIKKTGETIQIVKTVLALKMKAEQQAVSEPTRRCDLIILHALKTGTVLHENVRGLALIVRIISAGISMKIGISSSSCQVPNAV